MTRIPQPLIDDLVALRRDVDAIKTAQRIGPDSLLGYLTFSNEQYDYTFTMPAAPVGGLAVESYIVTFTNASAADGAIVKGTFYYAIDNSNAMTASIPPWQNSPSVTMTIQKLLPTATTSSWFLSFYATGALTHEIYLKFIFSGTDTGTWGVAAA